MNPQKLLPLALLICLVLQSEAQLPDGSVAPNFTVQDISGKEHNLYDLLDSGKIVILEFSATWCAPCWVYHNSHALQDFYNEFGPSGQDRARVLWIEGDPNTNTNCLYGPANCNGGSTGNYVAGSPYPIVDNHAIAALYKVSYYPTLYVICPSRRTKEVKPVSADKIWAQAQLCPVAQGTHNAGIFQFYAGTELREICGTQTWTPQFALTNLGTAPLNNAMLELKWNDQTLETLQWNGYLPTYGEVTISFSAHPFAGDGTMKTSILDINNGMGDDDPSNNTWGEAFGPAAQFDNNKILLRIRTDGYGEETYWELRDDTGNVLDKGGNELVGPDGGGKFPFGPPIGQGTYPNWIVVRDTLCLPSDGCYSIHFTDAYGDGICCDFGNGYYRLYSLDEPGIAIISGGTFGEYSRHSISSGTLSSNVKNPVAALRLDIFPNPASSLIYFDWDIGPGIPVSAEVYDARGQLYRVFPKEVSVAGGNQWSLSVDGWPAGVYFFALKTSAEVMVRGFGVK